jgi:Flp pilus assembly protein TadD
VAVLLASLAGAAVAQSGPTRVVAVPLQGPPELAPWQIGLAAGLQRSLNVLDGVFVPPVGDPVVLAERAASADLDAAATLRERFRADALLGGRVATAPGGLDVTLERYGPAGATAATTVTVPAVPTEALPVVVAEAIELLGLDASEEQRRAVQAVAAEAPSVETLQAVAVASARLAPPDPATLRAAAELDPDASWVRAEHARAASLAGDHERARDEARAATDAAPQDVEAWTIRGVVALRAGDDADAEEAYRAALERNPAHAVARAGLAQLLSGEDALREYRRALDAYPRLLEAHLAIAELEGGARGLQALRSAGEALPDAARLHAAVVDRALAANDAVGALAYLRETLERPLARRPGTYALAARLPADRREAALALLREGAEAFPEDVGLALAEAELLREGGDPAAAEARLRPLHEARPEEPRLANELALALLEQGRTDAARATLGAAAEGSATVRFNLAQALLEAGLPRAAAEELAPDAGEGQQDPEVWAVYGTALAASGRDAEAREALDRALALDADQPLARRTLRRLEERRRIAGAAGAEVPDAARAAYQRGLTDLEQGRFADAAAELARAYEQADGAPLVAFYRGTALQRDGRPDEALPYYQEAREAFPDSGTVLNNLGFAWLQQGRYDQALPTLRDAVDAAPDNARAHLNLGLVYYGLSRFEDALDAWERAVELDPALDEAIAETRDRARRQLPAEAP